MTSDSEAHHAQTQKVLHFFFLSSWEMLTGAAIVRTEFLNSCLDNKVEISARYHGCIWF